MGTHRNLVTGDPLDVVTFFDDFTDYAAGDWTITTVEAGGGNATEALSATLPGGVLVITNDNADNDADFFQLVGEHFAYTAGKRLRFAIRAKLSDALDSDFVAGLQITDTTPLAVSDGIFFRKSDGDNTLQLVVCKNSTETVVDVGELVDDTFFSAEFYYDGSTLGAYLDGVNTASAVLTNAPDDEQLTVSFGVQNGEAAAKVLSVDYVLAQMER